MRGTLVLLKPPKRLPRKFYAGIVEHPQPRLPYSKVNLYGFLKACDLTSEYPKFKNFRELAMCRWKPSCMEALKAHSVGIQAGKKLSRILEDYRQGYMPKRYGKFHNDKPEDEK